MRFHKYQALGNDYIVLDVPDLEQELRSSLVTRICDRHFGLGSDGILVETPAPEGTFGLRIINPDGSHAEKSGNGLRIFARYLWDVGRVSGEAFDVATPGGTVRCEVRESGRSVHVEMGTASFDSTEIPVLGAPREVVGEALEVDGMRFDFTAVTVGNPHCAIQVAEVSPALARDCGPLIENHPLFPNRTNVQFVQVLDSHRIRIEIWERGAGYTLASGSSSCAAAAASVRLGLCEDDVCVVMPGGTLDIRVASDFSLTMLGPVERVASGILAEELLAHDVSSQTHGPDRRDVDSTYG